jgi:hypothetical protein
MQSRQLPPVRFLINRWTLLRLAGRAQTRGRPHSSLRRWTTGLPQCSHPLGSHIPRTNAPPEAFGLQLAPIASHGTKWSTITYFQLPSPDPHPVRVLYFVSYMPIDPKQCLGRNPNPASPRRPLSSFPASPRLLRELPVRELSLPPPAGQEEALPPPRPKAP